MSDYPALRQLRIGCVQYLNARPLIAAYEGEVHYDHPAALADGLRSGDLDVALCPSFEIFERPESYYLVDGAAIASRGPVYSVFLAYQGELEAVRRVALDPASRTSTQLAHCLLTRSNHGGIEFVYEADEAEARVLIGNQAIRFRQSAGPEWRFLDFGEEWQRQTKLPFVFALWLMREDVEGAREAAQELREIKAAGLKNIAAIAAVTNEFSASFRHEYLTRYIHFDLGPVEKSGLWEFGRALEELDLAPRHPHAPHLYLIREVRLT